MDELVFDGSWVDMWTLGVALAYVSVRRFICRNMGAEAIMYDVSHGVTIFPMFLLSATVFSTTAVQTLMSGNKLIISLAGFFSLLALLKRTFERPDLAGPPKPQ